MISEARRIFSVFISKRCLQYFYVLPIEMCVLCIHSTGKWSVKRGASFLFLYQKDVHSTSMVYRSKFAFCGFIQMDKRSVKRGASFLFLYGNAADSISMLYKSKLAFRNFIQLENDQWSAAYFLLLYQNGVYSISMIYQSKFAFCDSTQHASFLFLYQGIRFRLGESHWESPTLGVQIWKSHSGTPNMWYIHAIHTCDTYTWYIHVIHTCNTYMWYIHTYIDTYIDTYDTNICFQMLLTWFSDS